jgi:hypothetical protein
MQWGDTVKDDKMRKWMWAGLALAAASQFYLVQELVAAFALFLVGSGAIVLVIASLYALLKGWEMLVARLAPTERAILPIGSVPLGSVKAGAPRASY